MYRHFRCAHYRFHGNAPVQDSPGLTLPPPSAISGSGSGSAKGWAVSGRVQISTSLCTAAAPTPSQANTETRHERDGQCIVLCLTDARTRAHAVGTRSLRIGRTALVLAGAPPRPTPMEVSGRRRHPQRGHRRCRRRGREWSARQLASLAFVASAFPWPAPGAHTS